MSWSETGASSLAKRLVGLSRTRPPWQAVATALTLGFGIWAGLVFILGGAEPWDRQVHLYLLAQAACGLLLGLIWPDSVAALWLLLLLGQGLAAGVGSFVDEGVGVDFLIPLGLVFLVLYSLPGLLALLLGRAIRKARTP